MLLHNTVITGGERRITKRMGVDTSVNVTIIDGLMLDIVEISKTFLGSEVLIAAMMLLLARVKGSSVSRGRAAPPR